MEDRTSGAWIIHHTNKIERYDTSHGFDDLYLAGKCGKLLSAISESEQEADVSKERLRVLAEACKINRIEQDGVINKLAEHRLIDQDSQGNIVTLGVTQTSLLTHTSKLFINEDPLPSEVASLTLSEYVSDSPIAEKKIKEIISDQHHLSERETQILFSNVEKFGIVDSENLGNEKLYFNGNLFRKGFIDKTDKIISSISSEEQRKVVELTNLLDSEACVTIEVARAILGVNLFEKLHAIGFYDVNSVSNSTDTKYLVTKPSAFSKFGDGLVEDALDLAKAFVSSLTYGIKFSSYYRGQILAFDLLMNKLLSGREIGSSTAIGEDYRALELRGVVRIRPDALRPGRFYMRLLKKDVGELAWEVLKNGKAVESVVFNKLNSKIHSYGIPESNRSEMRERIVTRDDKYAVAEKLAALRLKN